MARNNKERIPAVQQIYNKNYQEREGNLLGRKAWSAVNAFAHLLLFGGLFFLFLRVDYCR
jgi:hypothetical protein